MIMNHGECDEIPVCSRNNTVFHLLRKKNLTVQMSRVVIGGETRRRSPGEKDGSEQQSEIAITLFTSNMRIYYHSHKKIIQDIDDFKLIDHSTLTAANRRLSREEFLTQQTKRHIGRNTEVQRTQQNYYRLYRARFPEARQSLRDIKTCRYSVLTTSITHSSIERTQEKDAKPLQMSTLERKAKEFDYRYNNLLFKLPETFNDEVYIQRKKSHFAYFKRKLGSTQQRDHRLRASLKTIDRDSNERASGSRESREDLYRPVRMKECTFPPEASRCHSNRRILRGVLLLEEL